jgi:hypothetical protein
LVGASVIIFGAGVGFEVILLVGSNVGLFVGAEVG